MTDWKKEELRANLKYYAEHDWEGTYYLCELFRQASEALGAAERERDEAVERMHAVMDDRNEQRRQYEEMCAELIPALDEALRQERDEARREVEALKDMVEDAYNSGFGQGMREETSRRGGIPWMDSSFKKRIGR